jgi:ribose transport system permease protein
MLTALPFSAASDPARQRARISSFLRYAVVLALVAVFAFLSVQAPGFLTPSNLVNILENNFALLALVSLGMTLVISTGGIDLSVGTSIDMGSLVFVSLISSHYPLAVALLGGVLGALAVGVLNAFLIAVLGITPFLATLGTLFIGESVQQLATNGGQPNGQPIYLITGNLPAGFTFIGRGTLFEIPFPFYVVTASISAFFLLIHATRFGRQIVAFGAKAGVAWYSGLRIRHLSAWVYILSAIVCGIAGIILSSTVKAYVPLSGNAYLLDAIGATFIGTTLHPLSRPSIAGTVLGVLLLAVLTNGLLLVGWNFYWQQVARGLLIFAVLAVSFLGRRFQT